MLVATIVMLNILELIMKLLPNYPTIQKPNCRQFRDSTMAGYTDAMKPDRFTGGMGFKRWQIKCQLWLEAMGVWEVSNGPSEGTQSEEAQNKFKKDTTIFRGCVLSVLDARLCDVYMHIEDGKELWDALKAKFGATDAGNELYIMESFQDYKTVNNHGVVEQAHEIQCIAKELELLKCDLPDVCRGLHYCKTPSWMEEICYFSQALEA
jgi:hypothetical protein